MLQQRSFGRTSLLLEHLLHTADTNAVRTIDSGNAGTRPPNCTYTLNQKSAAVLIRMCASVDLDYRMENSQDAAEAENISEPKEGTENDRD